MQFLEQEVIQITKTTTAVLLEMEARLPAPSDAPLSQHCLLAGCVQILGAWEGAAAVWCPEKLAGDIARIMFDLPQGETPPKDLVEDALAEFANVIGGNVKALLPPHCKLGLPMVIHGTDISLRLQGCQVVCEIKFECGGQPLVVMLLERQPAAVN